ncbi:hypothetical protein EV360DRAFT_90566 [Lentinula raphanica]|nr:hypothetical protein EV360DRAFT_90566 [Lentinula raphanica]
MVTPGNQNMVPAPSSLPLSSPCPTTLEDQAPAPSRPGPTEQSVSERHHQLLALAAQTIDRAPDAVLTSDSDETETEAKRKLSSRVELGQDRASAPSRPGPSDHSVLERRRQLLALAAQTVDRAPEDRLATDSDEMGTEANKRKRRKHNKRTRKGKGKQKAMTSDEQDEGDTDHSQPAEASRPKGSKGRLSKAVQAEAFAIRQQYHSELEALAKKSGKNLSTLLAAVGDIVSDNRAMNVWNAFQSYAVHPDGLNLKHRRDQTEAEFGAEIQKRYTQLRNGEGDAKALSLDDILEWYRDGMEEDTAEKRIGGYTRKDIKKLCKPSINRARQLYEFRQLCSFGWIVDPVSAQAVPWGADPLFLALRDANPAQISVQAVDYGTMFHSQLMLENQAGVSLDPAKQALVNRFVDDGTNKVVLRGLVKDVLLMSLREIHPNKEFKQMKWGPAFADLCFKEKIKLVNYPAGLNPIGPRDGLAGASSIPMCYLKDIVKPYIRFWQQEAKAQKAEARRGGDAAALFDDDDDEDDGERMTNKVFKEDLVRFVAWDDNEKELSLADQAQIGILLEAPKGNNKPVVLARVYHSNIYLNRAASRNIRIDLPDETHARKENDDNSDSSSSDTETEVGVRHQRKVLRQWTPDTDGSDEDQIPARHRKKTTMKRHISREQADIHTDDEGNQTRRQKQAQLKELRHSRVGEQSRQPRSHHRAAKIAPVYGDETDEEHQHSHPRPRPRMIPPGGSRDIAEQSRHPGASRRPANIAPVSGDEEDE